MISICLNDLFYALSFALDSVESQLLGVSTYHGKRTAYLAVRMGQALGQADTELLHLASAAVLHDNALTEYISSERAAGGIPDLTVPSKLAAHCLMGERNMQKLPFYPAISSAVLLHHEQADGGGPFHKTTEETPLFAQLIHFADNLDGVFHLEEVSPAQFEAIRTYMKANAGTLFAPVLTETFLQLFDLSQLQQMQGVKIEGLLRQTLPAVTSRHTPQALAGLADIFARIIDYKSAATRSHSVGIAEKAAQIGRYYSWDEDLCAKFRLAGALHDVGKLLVDTDILEKPGKLTPEEYQHIQRHALVTEQLLSSVHGLEDITCWASRHHEKLDGSGYPYGKTGDALGKKERIMACLDIYQALTEERPYKAGMPHTQAIKILRAMAGSGQLDSGIVEDLAVCFLPQTAPAAL